MNNVNRLLFFYFHFSVHNNVHNNFVLMGSEKVLEKILFTEEMLYNKIVSKIHGIIKPF